MEAILLAIYAFFVWLIFIKFKWLPWNTATQVIVVIIPVVAMAALILTLNVVAPSSSDVRVFKYVVQVVPQVRGRVIEVPVEPNRLVRKGEVEVHLTPIEYRLLGVLIANAGRVLTHPYLLREVWGPSHAQSTHYLRVYMGNLRQKLEDDSAQPRHIVTETGVGYRLLID